MGQLFVAVLRSHSKLCSPFHSELLEGPLAVEFDAPLHVGVSEAGRLAAHCGGGIH